jgi:NAD(P)-dependent dehydrogenase (short-subunit alcohol dehydrogenase family)
MGNELRLEGKRALVTGSGTGIGHEIALEFAREGADVVLHYSHSAAGAEESVEKIKEMGKKAIAIKADFCDVDQVEELGHKAIEFLGGIDCLVNNAGITFNKRFLKVTKEQYDTTYNVNIKAQFFLTQVVVEDMIKHGGGAIVNLTSVHGLSGAPEHSVYAGTKGAIMAYTRSLAVELAHMGIRVNAIAPGMVVVPNYFKSNITSEEEAKQTAYDKIPLGRSGDSVEIGRLAAFLCSDECGYIIGQTIVADGGTTSLMSLISDFRNEATASLGVGYIPGI